MQKSIDNKKETTPEEPKHKGKKKKRNTECSVMKRQYGNCGICGSEDVVYEIYVCCEVCGKDTLELNTDRYRFFNRINPCSCKDTIKYRNKSTEIDSKKFVREIANCNACGAYKGPLCVNCKKPLWYKFDEAGDKKHCTGLWSGCGYVINV